jgi:hypothetical protein
MARAVPWYMPFVQRWSMIRVGNSGTCRRSCPHQSTDTSRHRQFSPHYNYITLVGGADWSGLVDFSSAAPHGLSPFFFQENCPFISYNLIFASLQVPLGKEFLFTSISPSPHGLSNHVWELWIVLYTVSWTWWGKSFFWGLTWINVVPPPSKASHDIDLYR